MDKGRLETKSGVVIRAHDILAPVLPPYGFRLSKDTLGTGEELPSLSQVGWVRKYGNGNSMPAPTERKGRGSKDLQTIYIELARQARAPTWGIIWKFP